MKPDPGLSGWLQLSLSPGLTPSTLRRLLADFGLPDNVLSRPRAELVRYAPASAVDTLFSHATAEAVAKALDWARRPGHSIVTLADEAYPRPLLEVPDPPLLLYIAGRMELLARPALAVVGSRNATPQGESNAEAFARSLSQAGLTIVSGLALGIDAAAHRGGLGGPGSTVAVLGTGIDVLYPRRNAELAEQISQRGALVSEFALGTEPAAYHFPRRNRLISGISRGCLVVEAAAASGSLITAKLAAEQGREVFAIPGSIHSPLSKGCHALIKSGAKLVESAEDVLSELSGFASAAPVERRTAAQPIRAQGEDALLDHMGHDPVDIDLLCTRAGLSPEQVASHLLRLELDGRITALPGGLYQRLEKGPAR